MDLATIGGFLIAIGMVVGGAALEHVKVGSMIGLSAFLIVIGGSVGATMLAHTMDDLKHVGGALKMAIFPKKLDYPGMIAMLTELADKARRGGVLSLQEDVEKATNPLVKHGLTRAVDGADPESIEELLDAMSSMEVETWHHAAAVFETAGGYAPTLGIMGTVMGLVTIMGNLADPAALGPAIAVAFLATLYGVAFANLIFLPVGAKVKATLNQQKKFNEMIITGIIGIQSGETSRALTDRLTIFMGSHAGKEAKK